MRVLFSDGIRVETCPIDSVSKMHSLSFLSKLMEKSRSDERDDSLHSRCWDPHIRMALRPVGILAHRSDGDIRVSQFHFFTGCGDYS